MKTKSILFATLAVIATGLFAPILSAAPSEGAERKGPPAGERGERIEKLKEELGLTPGQLEKLRPLMREQMEAVKALREDESLSREDKRAKMKELREAHQAKLAEVLTPEQAAKLKELRKDRPGGPEGKGGKEGERKGPPPPRDEEA